ncbi:MAG: hypothetical protein QOC94_466 [Actinoplanes sp.]|jgi:hypothetical protein|nr:hypothetical protein [Actinoplanes sp.]
MVARRTNRVTRSLSAVDMVTAPIGAPRRSVSGRNQAAPARSRRLTEPASAPGPEPYQKLAMGSVWDARDVEAWIKDHRPQIAEDTES